MKDEQRQQRDRDLKQAALLVMEVFPEIFKDLDGEESKFVKCFHDILFDINQSTDESEGEHRFTSTYSFPDTLKAMQKAMEHYQSIYHVLGCIESWSKYSPKE